METKPVIRFACKLCGKKIATPEKNAGRLAPCIGCKSPIRVPEESDPVEPPPIPESAYQKAAYTLCVMIIIHSVLKYLEWDNNRKLHASAKKIIGRIADLDDFFYEMPTISDFFTRELPPLIFVYAMLAAIVFGVIKFKSTKQ